MKPSQIELFQKLKKYEEEIEHIKRTVLKEDMTKIKLYGNVEMRLSTTSTDFIKDFFKIRLTATINANLPKLIDETIKQITFEHQLLLEKVKEVSDEIRVDAINALATKNYGIQDE